jgi:hypothetical protein
MDNRLSSVLEKILILKHKGSLSKALDKLGDVIKKNPHEIKPYIEAIDISLEAGESLQAWQYFKEASSNCRDHRDQIWAFAKEKIKSYDDPVLAKMLMEHAIRDRDLESGRQITLNLQPHTATELLQRTLVKKKTLISNSGDESLLQRDLLINLFSEALLCLRIGKPKEAIKIFIHILDNKPVENQVLKPFLLQLQESMPDNSSIHYASGCSYLTSKKYREAISAFIKSVRINQAFADDIIDRMEKMRKTNGPMPEDLEMVLSEIYLIKGKPEKAVVLINYILKRHREKAPAIFDLISRFQNDAEESRILQYALIESAILAKLDNQAIDKIKQIYQDTDQRDALLAWLDKKYTDHLLPADMLLTYAEIALDERMTERAVPICRDLSEMSPIDIPSILRLLEKHTDLDPDIGALHRELVGRSKRADDASDFELEKSDDFAVDSCEDLCIEQFENNDFSLSSQDVPSHDHPAESPPNTEDFQTGTFETPLGVEFSLHGSEKKPIDHKPLDTPKKVEGLPCEEKELEQKKRMEGRPSLHPTGPDPHEEPTRTQPVKEIEPSIDDNGFDERYQAFLQGKADDAEIILLIDEAFTAGRVEKLKRLLSFKPKNLNEETRRKLYLARFHIYEDKPLQALAVLKSIPLEKLSREARYDVLLRVAACYRSVHMYEAAHGALLKITSDKPSPLIEKLVKQNYSDYINQQSNGAIVLEKIGSIKN